MRIPNVTKDNDFLLEVLAKQKGVDYLTSRSFSGCMRQN